MGRLSKHGGDRQHELFSRSELQAHFPGLGHFAAVERRRVQHEPRPVLWEGMGSWVRVLASFPEGWQRSERQDARFVKAARLIDAEKIRASRDVDGLERVRGWLEDSRNNELCTVFTRAELGALLVEVRNRLHLLAIGRDQPKTKGPRLDPSRLPLDALERLIQRHPDLQMVDLLRAERARRAA